jgi:hypothetical protein
MRQRRPQAAGGIGLGFGVLSLATSFIHHVPSEVPWTLGIAGTLIILATAFASFGVTVIRVGAPHLVVEDQVDASTTRIEDFDLTAEPPVPRSRLARTLSVMVYNAREHGDVAEAVVPTIEARFRDWRPEERAKVESNLSKQGIAIRDHRETLRRSVVRGHGRWLRDPFGARRQQGEPRDVRRRDLPPTGERERLGLLFKYEDDPNAHILDAPTRDDQCPALWRGDWSLKLILRGRNIKPVRVDFDVQNLGEDGPVILHRVELGRRFLVGPERVRIIASGGAIVLSPEEKRHWWGRRWLNRRRQARAEQRTYVG